MSKSIILSECMQMRIAFSNCTSPSNAFSLLLNNNSAIDANTILAITISDTESDLKTLKILLESCHQGIARFELSPFGDKQEGSLDNVPSSAACRTISSYFDLKEYYITAKEIESRRSNKQLNPDPVWRPPVHRGARKSNGSAAAVARNYKPPLSPLRRQAGGGSTSATAVTTLNSFAAIEDQMSDDVDSTDDSAVSSAVTIMTISPSAADDGDKSQRKRQATGISL